MKRKKSVRLISKPKHFYVSYLIFNPVVELKKEQAKKMMTEEEERNREKLAKKLIKIEKKQMEKEKESKESQ
jgi:hypothetical protein